MDPDPILPSTCLLATLVWEIEATVTRAQRHQPDPGTGPPNRLFVPDSVRSKVLLWAHSNRLTCHPGITRTLAFLHQRFWWSTMVPDTQAFIAACPTCAQNKTSTRPLSGLLHPLPIPTRPWSHIAVDFVTGLPNSNGNTTILTIIDRFSKAAHFVALPALPSARGTADLLVPHVFCLHGIPSNIVSDRGPQFISRLARLLRNPGSHHKPLFWLPPPIQWSSRVSESGDGVYAPLRRLLQPFLLEYSITMGRVRPQLPL